MCKKSSRPDLLSVLPLGIIHIILSFIPLRDAVKTSFLSRQWRYIWCSLPRLAFDASFVKQTIIDQSDEHRLIHLITQVLLLHEGTIHKFELHQLKSLVQFEWVNSWLLFLSRKNIRVLVFQFVGGFHQPVDSNLYSCQYLTHLELCFCDVNLPPPSFKGFLRLRSLRLSKVGLFSSSFESILAHCPVLEELTLVGLSLLQPFQPFQTLLEEFEGDSTQTRTFNIGAESFRRSSVFPHLRIIKLSNVPFNDQDMTASFIRLITGSPNLHKLEISDSLSWINDASKLPCASLWDIETAPKFTYDSLKVIEMDGFGDTINQMKLVKFLVGRSPVLEKMVYKPHLSLSDLELLKLVAQLARYRRASANAEIVIVDHRV